MGKRIKCAPAVKRPSEFTCAAARSVVATRVAALVAFGASMLFMLPLIWRDLWFDEALTVLNFAVTPAWMIYFNYAIPNNQIVYTMLLHFWLDCCPNGLRLDVWMRLLSLAAAAGVLMMLFTALRRRVGRYAACAAVLTLGVSLPFAIYGTALRGYMVGTAFSLLFFFAMRIFLRSGRWCWWLSAFFAAIGAVGVVPSDLAVLTAALLTALPNRWSGVWSIRRRILMAMLGVGLAFTLFYLPIFPALLAVAGLGEGWRSSGAAGGAFYLAAGVTLLPLLPGIAGWFRGDLFRTVCRIAILLLPGAAWLVLPTAPFPRVFFPLLPFFAITLAEGWRRLAARRRLTVGCHRLRLRGTAAVFAGLAAIALWGGAVRGVVPMRNFLSEHSGGIDGDDYFNAGYLRESFTPSITMIEAKKRGGVRFYFSFKADPWALSFYAKLLGFESGALGFDNPRFKIDWLPPGTMAILRNDELPSDLELRFNCRLTPLFQTGTHRVFTVEARP